MLTFLRTNFKLLGISLALIFLAYNVGSWNGARKERNAEQARQLLADANSAINTVSGIFKVKAAYDDIYKEIPKHVEVPSCPAPRVIRDTINRLPGDKATH